MRYFHSVHLIESKCKGCVNCIKRCPTEAIRVRDGKAHIIEERCIDCGECVRNCPNKAKEVVADGLEAIKDFKYNIAIPAPAIYGQFRQGTDPSLILSAFIELGFDEAFDVAFAADLVAVKVKEAVQESKIRPLISSACPAVVRLIQVRFPNLLENIIPIVSPMRVAARMARTAAIEKTGLKDDEIGVFFISPCPGKVSAIMEPAGFAESYVDGAIPISAVFPLIQGIVSHGGKKQASITKGSAFGIGWGRAGGENQAIGADRHLSVDGIHNAIDILEDIERGKLSDIDYIEVQACIGGCVGGVLTVENSFITRRRIRIIASDYSLAEDEEQVWSEKLKTGLREDSLYEFDMPIHPRPTLKLDQDMNEAIRKLSAIDSLVEELPGLDCGSCGAPNCRALAEDVVQGLAAETDCVFKLREKVKLLAEELMQMAAQIPPSMSGTPKNVGHDESSGADKRA